MKEQFRRWGILYDWSKEITSCMPDYYRWNQWLFLRMLEKGLAYKKTAPVNWCPSCRTVLANEQVVDGACERCGTAGRAEATSSSGSSASPTTPSACSPGSTRWRAGPRRSR